jgi:hypothetical protein
VDRIALVDITCGAETATEAQVFRETPATRSLRVVATQTVRSFLGAACQSYIYVGTPVAPHRVPSANGERTRALSRPTDGQSLQR